MKFPFRTHQMKKKECNEKQEEPNKMERINDDFILNEWKKINKNTIKHSSDHYQCWCWYLFLPFSYIKKRILLDALISSFEHSFDSVLKFASFSHLEPQHQWTEPYNKACKWISLWKQNWFLAKAVQKPTFPNEFNVCETELKTSEVSVRREWEESAYKIYVLQRAV